MAVFREQPTCPICGEPIEGIYHPIPDGFVGDSFVRWDWEGHECKNKKDE